jgi:hypothetical protein
MKPELMEAALGYAARGWRVFPINTVDADGRCSCGSIGCSSAGKHPVGHLAPRGVKDASVDLDVIRSWWATFPTANIGLATGRASGIVVLDVDAKSGGLETLARLEADHGVLPPAPRVRTGGGGGHYWFRYPEGVDRLGNSVSRIGMGLDVRADGGYVVAPPSMHRSGVPYEWEVPPADLELQPGGVSLPDLPHWIASPVPVVQPVPEQEGSTIPTGSRNDTLFRIGRGLRLRGLSDEAVAAALRADNEARCDPPLERDELERLIRQVHDLPDADPADGVGLSSASSASSAGRVADEPWPEPMLLEALIGVAGDFVRAVAPHTEADAHALLVQFLVGVGNLFGRRAHVNVGAEPHYANTNVVLVGNTSRGRKGTAWANVRQVLAEVDPAWADECITSGLSSGEGVIYAVRDPITKISASGQQTTTDPGVVDKRLLVVEPEFAQALKVAGREGNILSPTIRQAWDSGDLRTMTKNSPTRATGAHISIIGHITQTELRRHLASTDMANGFANRMNFILVRRSKLLPHGGHPDPDVLKNVANEVAQSIQRVQRIPDRIRRSDGFRTLWERAYPELTRDRPGLLGAVLARAEAQVLRFALIYALLEASWALQGHHLRAALAVWTYIERSSEIIFGQLLGDPVADDLLEALRRRPGGLTRTDINRLLGGHRSSGTIGASLALLEREGLAHVVTEATSGRPIERWFATPRKKLIMRGKPPISTPSSASSASSAPTTQPLSAPDTDGHHEAPGEPDPSIRVTVSTAGQPAPDQPHVDAAALRMIEILATETPLNVDVLPRDAAALANALETAAGEHRAHNERLEAALRRLRDNARAFTEARQERSTDPLGRTIDSNKSNKDEGEQPLADDEDVPDDLAANPFIGASARRARNATTVANEDGRDADGGLEDQRQELLP